MRLRIMSEPKPQHPFVPPPHPNAEVHKRVMERIKAMSPEEVLQLNIRAGIYDEEGRLRPEYVDQEDQDEG